MDVATELNVVVAIDTHHLLDDICFARHINAVAWNTELPSILLTRDDLDLEALEDTHRLITRDDLPDEGIHMAGTQRDFVGLSRYGIVIKAIPIDIAPRAKLQNEGSGTHQCPSRAVGIQTSLEAEGRVGIDSYTASGLTDGGSVEVRRFKEDLRRRLGRPRLQSSHHTSHAERSALS